MSDKSECESCSFSSYSSSDELTATTEIRTSFHSYKTSGWLKLQPFLNFKRRKNRRKLNSLTFPINYSYTYTIGSTSDKDLILPRTMEMVPEVVIRTENAQVVLENVSHPELEAKFKVDYKFVKPEKEIKFEIRSSTFRHIADLQFGPFKYSYELRRCSAIGSAIVSKLSDFIKCVKCKGFWRIPSSLPCGHILCQRCANSFFSFVLDDENSNSVRFRFNRRRRLEPINYLYCRKCSKKSTMSDILESPNPPWLSSLGDRIAFLFKIRPSCAKCGNTRCMAAYCDCWKCRTCSMELCPLCVMDEHNDHEVYNIYSDMVKRGSAFDRKFLIATFPFEKLKKRMESVSRKIEETNGHLNGYLTQIEKCKSVLDDILSPFKTVYCNMMALENFELSAKSNQARTEIEQLFQSMIQANQPCLISAITDLMKNASTIRKIGSKTSLMKI